MSYILWQVKIPLKCKIFMFSKDIFLVLHHNIFLGFFHYFGHHGRPASIIFNQFLSFDNSNLAMILKKNIARPTF